ncbi:hypothetical protein ACFLZP_00635 [Patescibacteria group bacterium]
MKNRCLVGFLLLSLFLAPPFCWGQASPTLIPTINLDLEKTFVQTYQEYLNVYDIYREDYKNYQLAKSQYETYQTLASKTIALERMTILLQTRTDVLIAFTIALRHHIAETTKIASSELNLLYLQLDDQIDWYREHKDTLTSAGSIPDLVKLSNEAQKRYSLLESLIYQSLLEVYTFQEDRLHQRVQDQINAVEKKVLGLRTEGERDTSTLERWLLEVKNRKERANEKITEARPIKVSSKDNSRSKRNTYNRGIKLLEQSHQYLKETSLALMEIIGEIKNEY